MKNYSGDVSREDIARAAMSLIQMWGDNVQDDWELRVRVLFELVFELGWRTGDREGEEIRRVPTVES